LACPAPKITKETCSINWNRSAKSVHNLIRGLSPFPGAFFELRKKKYKIFKSALISRSDLKPGEIEETKKQIFVGTEAGSIELLEIQPEGRKRMKADEFLRGYSLIRPR